MLVKDGYREALIGALVGSLVLGGVGVALVMLLMPCDEREILGCLGTTITGSLALYASIFIGAPFGCYVALRLRGCVKPGQTAWTLAIFNVLAPAVLSLVRVSAGAYLWLVVSAGLAVLARKIVLQRVANRPTEGA